MVQKCWFYYYVSAPTKETEIVLLFTESDE